MDFKSIRNKAVETAKTVKSNEKLGDIWDKAVDKATAPKTNKQLLVAGAISVATGLVMGGALPVLVAGAAAEAVVTKQVTKRLAARKTAKQQEQDNTKPADDAKPAGNAKPDSRKDGPKPQ
jgi:type III secretory pathway component EscV